MATPHTGIHIAVYGACLSVILLSSVGAMQLNTNAATIQSEKSSANVHETNRLKVNTRKPSDTNRKIVLPPMNQKNDETVHMERQIAQNSQTSVTPCKAGEQGCLRQPGTNQQPVQSRGLGEDIPLVEDGKYWSQVVEKLLPAGLTDKQYEDWIQKTGTRKIIYMESGTLSTCGRDGNAHAIMDDGTRMCVRNSKLGTMGVVGEVLAFQLARALQIHTVPAIALSRVSTNENSPWGRQKSRLEDLAMADGVYVALIEWTPGLSEANFPSLIQQEPHSVDTESPLLNELDVPSLVYLAEWTDLVLFDYITGHIDRMTSVLDAIRKSGEKWLIRQPIHNLGRNEETGAICIFDNECAFYVSYLAMTNTVTSVGKNITEMYEELLKSVCIFRRATVDAINKLRNMDDVGGFLYNRVKESDPVAREYLTEVLNDRFTVDNAMLKRRIASVYTHIQTCNQHRMMIL